MSLPERAMLGLQYQNIFNLAKAWATEHKSDFFPQDDSSACAWIEAFDSFLRYNRPFKPLFEILHSDFELALQQKALRQKARTPSWRAGRSSRTARVHLLLFVGCVSTEGRSKPA